jgi:hypothetical protein
MKRILKAICIVFGITAIPTLCLMILWAVSFGAFDLIDTIRSGGLLVFNVIAMFIGFLVVSEIA